MSAQRVATGIGLAALAALLLNVGLPAVLPPEPVPEIEIVVPAGDRGGEQPDPPGEPRIVPPARVDNQDQSDDDDDGDDSDDDDDDQDNDQDDLDDDDSPAGDPDDTPDDDDGDDDD